MRLPTFRLRSLMIVVVILALALTVAVQAIRTRREEARAAEAARMAQLQYRAARAASGTTAVLRSLTGPTTPASSEGEPWPHHKASVTCFNGKVDSGSRCSIGLHRPDGTSQKAGKLTCGYPGKTSEIEYAFLGSRDGKDIYAFTRRFPLDTPEMSTTRREVEFSGERIKVFEDESQSIVIEGDG